jgi:hypothetical protein
MNTQYGAVGSPGRSGNSSLAVATSTATTRYSTPPITQQQIPSAASAGGTGGGNAVAATATDCAPTAHTNHVPFAPASGGRSASSPPTSIGTT